MCPSLILNLVSSDKSHHLIRKAVLINKKGQKETKEKEPKDAAEQILELQSKIENLRQKIVEKDQEIEWNDAERIILGNLYEEIIINEDGNLLQ